MKGRERGTKMAREKEKGSQVMLSPPPLPARGVLFCSLVPHPGVRWGCQRAFLKHRPPGDGQTLPLAEAQGLTQPLSRPREPRSAGGPGPAAPVLDSSPCERGECWQVCWHSLWPGARSLLMWARRRLHTHTTAM